MIVLRAETMGTFNTELDTVNLHHPTSLSPSPSRRPASSSMLRTTPLHPVKGLAVRQGLTLVHFPAQRKHLLWDGGCSGDVRGAGQGVFRWLFGFTMCFGGDYGVF